MIIDIDKARKLATKLYELYGYNILNYDLAFVQKTFIKFSERHNCENYESIEKLLLSDETLIHDFLDELFINVTEMFRDPEVFRVIRDKIIPYLKSYPIIKIWSAGCAIGLEAYSLAIILKELDIYDRSIIYATDIDSDAVKRAEIGRYDCKSFFKNYENYYLSGGKERFSRYFEMDKDIVTINNQLKENICFATHNIITDEAFNTFSLILCRNMFIYFDDSLQSKGLNTFRHSLEHNGFLVLGKSESLHFNGGYTYFKAYDEANRIYKLKH